MRELRRLELTAVRESLRAREQAAGRAVAEVLEAARAPTLFGERRPLDAAGRRVLAEKRRMISNCMQFAQRASSEGFTSSAADGVNPATVLRCTL